MKHYEVGNPKPEFVIGLAGPVGTDLRSVTKALTHELRAYKYHTVPIRISELLHQWCTEEVKELIESAPEDKRIDYLMNAGDILRNQARSGAALIPLVTTAIRFQRQKFLLGEGCIKDHDEVELYNHCFIINSLKHPDEVHVLREIYGSKFIMVSVILPQKNRMNNLRAKIAASHSSTDDVAFTTQAEALVDKDRKRSGNELGQNIGGTFHLADFFLRSGTGIQEDINRFFAILFGHPNATPTRNEFIMFEARSNALRSADLSRQVGAVITNESLEIVSRGCNEVPVVNGDTFWPEDKGKTTDTRDYAEGKDYNAVKKVEILHELVDYLVTDKKLLATTEYSTPSNLVNELVFGKYRSSFKDLRISNLVEFGRMVHAEMFALMEAARRGLSVDKGVLYCTSFPCHMCARHIIAAGIREVFYIEPYPKSMTAELYKDMIAIDADPSDVKKAKRGRPSRVYFQPFHGVAPRIYSEAFAMTKRKDDRGYRLALHR